MGRKGIKATKGEKSNVFPDSPWIAGWSIRGQEVTASNASEHVVATSAESIIWNKILCCTDIISDQFINVEIYKTLN